MLEQDEAHRHLQQAWEMREHLASPQAVSDLHRYRIPLRMLVGELPSMADLHTHQLGQYGDLSQAGPSPSSIQSRPAYLALLSCVCTSLVHRVAMPCQCLQARALS